MHIPKARFWAYFSLQPAFFSRFHRQANLLDSDVFSRRVVAQTSYNFTMQSYAKRVLYTPFNRCNALRECHAFRPHNSIAKMTRRLITHYSLCSIELKLETIKPASSHRFFNTFILLMRLDTLFKRFIAGQLTRIAS
jgi:hypothetical protein